MIQHGSVAFYHYTVVISITTTAVLVEAATNPGSLSATDTWSPFQDRCREKSESECGDGDPLYNLPICQWNSNEEGDCDFRSSSCPDDLGRALIDIADCGATDMDRCPTACVEADIKALAVIQARAGFNRSVSDSEFEDHVHLDLNISQVLVDMLLCEWRLGLIGIRIDCRHKFTPDNVTAAIRSYLLTMNQVRSRSTIHHINQPTSNPLLVSTTTDLPSLPRVTSSPITSTTSTGPIQATPSKVTSTGRDTMSHVSSSGSRRVSGSRGRSMLLSSRWRKSGGNIVLRRGRHRSQPGPYYGVRRRCHKQRRKHHRNWT